MLKQRLKSCAEGVDASVKVLLAKDGQSRASRVGCMVQGMRDCLNQQGIDVGNDAAVSAVVLAFMENVIIPRLYALDEVVKEIEVSEKEQPKHLVNKIDRSIKPTIIPPTNLISLVHLISINTAIEALYGWVIHLFNASVMKVDIVEHIYPKTLSIPMEDFVDMRDALSKEAKSGYQNIFLCIKCLYSIVLSKAFKGWLLQRNLKRIILSLLCMINDDSNGQTAETVVAAKGLLDDLAYDKEINHLVVSELRWAAQGSNTIKLAASRVMTAILQSENGLYAVLLGYLQGVTDDPNYMKVLLGVAKLVGSVPSSSSKLDYFNIICPQLIDNYHYAIKQKDIVLMKVCVMIIVRISKVCPELCDTLIIQPLASPLLQLLLVQDDAFHGAISDEIGIERAIMSFYYLLTLCPIYATLMTSIRNARVDLVFLQFYILIFYKCKISLMFAKCGEVVTILCQQLQLLPDELTGLAVVEHILLNEPTNHVQLGPNGGIEIVKREQCGKVPEINSSAKKSSNILSLGSILEEVKKSRALDETSFAEPIRHHEDDAKSPSDYLQDILQLAGIDSLNSPGGSESNVTFSGHCIIEVERRCAAIMPILLELTRNTSGTINPTTNTPDSADAPQRTLLSSLFMQSVKFYLGITKNEKRSIYGLILMYLMSNVSMDVLLQQGLIILTLLFSYIENYSAAVTGELLYADEDSEEKQETCVIVLQIIQSIVLLGNSRRGSDEEQILRQLLQPLQSIATKVSNLEVSQLATDLSLLLLSRSSSLDSFVKSIASSSNHDTFNHILMRNQQEFLSHETPAFRGLGIRNIIVALNSNTAVSMEDTIACLQILLHMLNDSDSFVYLHVIKALAVLAHHNRQNVSGLLMDGFTNGSVTLESTNISLDIRQRSLIGDALSLIIRRTGHVLTTEGSNYVVGCLAVIRSVAPPSATADAIIDEKFDLSRVKFLDKDNMADELMEGNEDTMHAIISAENLLLRQSAVSLLAEAIAHSGYDAERHLMEVVDVARSVLLVEYRQNQTNAAMRRSAIFLVKYIVMKINHRLFSLQHAGYHLKSIYTCLKLSRNDNDKVVKFQADNCIEYFNQLVLEQLQGGYV